MQHSIISDHSSWWRVNTKGDNRYASGSQSASEESSSVSVKTLATRSGDSNLPSWPTPWWTWLAAALRSSHRLHCHLLCITSRTHGNLYTVNIHCLHCEAIAAHEGGEKHTHSEVDVTLSARYDQHGLQFGTGSSFCWLSLRLPTHTLTGLAYTCHSYTRKIK